VSAGDGVAIHYEERGSGPLVVIGSYWSMHPPALEPLMSELERDHRVVHYDERGTGESTMAGPYDIATGAADLRALLQALGEPAVIAGDG
jgi:pimeloyl-ACP methyl ester carboxylesterase